MVPLVLVADDDAMIRELICDALTDAGLRTLTAVDGEEALALVELHQPSVLVLDIMMPKMNGYAVLTRLRGRAATAGIPVIILTGETDPLCQALSARLGAVVHLTKPFYPTELTAAVRQVLEGRAG